jgi:hypothetical protein
MSQLFLTNVSKQSFKQSNMVSLGMDNTYEMISNPMCEFLSLPYGSQIIYFDMMMKVMEYCTIHNLFEGTRIKTTNQALNTLLGIDSSFDLNLLTIHSVLEKHIQDEEMMIG